MDLEKFLCYVLPILLLVAVGIVVYWAFQKSHIKAVKFDGMAAIGISIVNNIPSNNTFPKLTDIFCNLELGLKRNQMEFNTNLKGYITNE